MHDCFLRPMDKHTILQRFYQQARNQLELAKLIAHYAHEGQMRKTENEPYIVHPARIATQLKSDKDKCVAWLHDVVEDSNIELKDLKEFFSENTVHAVDCLTKVKGDVDATLTKIKHAPNNVQIIKLLDVLDYWRHCHGMSQESIALNTGLAKEFYLPLAEQLGEEELKEKIKELVIQKTISR